MSWHSRLAVRGSVALRCRAVYSVAAGVPSGGLGRSSIVSTAPSTNRRRAALPSIPSDTYDIHGSQDLAVVIEELHLRHTIGHQAADGLTAGAYHMPLAKALDRVARYASHVAGALRDGKTKGVSTGPLGEDLATWRLPEPAALTALGPHPTDALTGLSRQLVARLGRTPKRGHGRPALRSRTARYLAWPDESSSPKATAPIQATPTHAATAVMMLRMLFISTPRLPRGTHAPDL